MIEVSITVRQIANGFIVSMEPQFPHGEAPELFCKDMAEAEQETLSILRREMTPPPSSFAEVEEEKPTDEFLRDRPAMNTDGFDPQPGIPGKEQGGDDA